MIVPGLARSMFAVALLAGVGAGAAGCGPTPTSPSVSVPFSLTDLRLGTGTDAVSGKTLTANYTGWLYDSTKSDLKGLLFETSSGGVPIKFTLGAGAVITGLERGMEGMKVGGARRVVIPPSLGYGISRNGPIPPFATLIFEVELLDAQ